MRGIRSGFVDHPKGVAVDEQQVFVCSSVDHCVSVFSKASGAFVRKIGSKGSGQGQLFDPYDICLDGNNVYVCERANHPARVQVLTKEGVRPVHWLCKWGWANHFS